MLKTPLAAGLFFLLTTVTGFASDFHPGQYEITSKVEMPGMPVGSIPAQTAVVCLTEEEPVPAADASESGCEIKNVEKTGNTVKWSLVCTQEGEEITGNGTMTYSPDGFTGTSTIQTGPQAGNMQVITKMTGKRIGNCPN